MLLHILMLARSFLTDTKRKQDIDNQSFYIHTLLLQGSMAGVFYYIGCLLIER